MTDTTIPDYMPILSSGSHDDPSKGVCLLELASFLAGEEWSDSPACTHPVLATMGRRVNDRLGDDRRQELLALLPRLMGTAPTGTEAERKRLPVSLSVWCAEQVVHLAGESEPQAREAIRVTRAWLAGEATEDECRAAANAAYVAYAATNAATNAAAYAAYAYAYACSYAAYHAANAAGMDLVALLDGLITEHERLTGRVSHVEITPEAVAPLTEAMSQ